MARFITTKTRLLSGAQAFEAIFFELTKSWGWLKGKLMNYSLDKDGVGGGSLFLHLPYSEILDQRNGRLARLAAAKLQRLIAAHEISDIGWLKLCQCFLPA